MCGRIRRARNSLPSRFTASLSRPSRYSSITPGNYPGGGAAWHTYAVGSSFGRTARASTRPCSRLVAPRSIYFDEMSELLSPSSHHDAHPLACFLNPGKAC